VTGSPLIDQDAIRGIVADVFRVMLKLKAEPLENGREEASGTRVTATVTLSGPPGSVPACYGFALEMPELLAFKIAALLSPTPIVAWSSLVEDACGEVVNLLAGNAKKHLTANYTLSVPTVVHGKDYHWSMPKLEVKQIERFRCGDALVQVYLGEERGA